jgi:hypothetical protein
VIFPPSLPSLFPVIGVWLFKPGKYFEITDARMGVLMPFNQQNQHFHAAISVPKLSFKKTIVSW